MSDEELEVGQSCELSGTIEGIGMDARGITIYIRIGNTLIILSHDEFIRATE